MKLLVYKTLKKNGPLHFLIKGSKYITNIGSNEIYDVSFFRIIIVDIVEFFCGYRRVTYENGISCYIRWRL